MRLNLDLQPFERKAVTYYCPSPVIIVLLIIVSIGHFGYLEFEKKQIGGIEQNVVEALAQIQARYSEVQATKAALLSEQRKYKTDYQDFNSISEKLSRQRLSWYTLFSTVEDAVPEELFLNSVKNDEDDIRLFTISGEASGMSKIIFFTDQLLKSDYFSSVSIVKSEKVSRDEFGVEVYMFEINCRFLG